MTADESAPEKGAPETETAGSSLPRVPSYIVGNDGNHMVVEGDHEYMRKNKEYRQGYVASIMTLCLSIMGGAVLPVPSAFSTTGAVAATVICVVVATANVFTADLLIRQCYKTGSRDYEELAYATGGSVWLVITRLVIVLLLFGSIISQIQQTGEAVLTGIQAVQPDLPDWVTYADDSGYVIMVLFTIVISYPLCMIRELRSLEYVGVVGFFVVIFLTCTVVVQSCIAGLPALKSGDFPAVGFSSMKNIGSAVSTLGFAFYIQPLMMPLLNEMPGPPRAQARILSWAMRFVVVVFAGGVYFFIGFFGAAWYGANTNGNILNNSLLGGGAGWTVLNLLFALYLAFGVPSLEFPIRRVIDNWLPGDKGGLLRNMLISTFIIVAALLVAMFWHTGSSKLIILTGATGVLMASYVCPVVNHFLLYSGSAKCQKEAESEFSMHIQRPDGSVTEGHLAMKMMQEVGVPPGEALPPMGVNSAEAVGKPGVLTYAHATNPNASALVRAWEGFCEIVAPVLVVCLGVFSSVVSLYYFPWNPSAATAGAPAPAPAPAPGVAL